MSELRPRHQASFWNVSRVYVFIKNSKNQGKRFRVKFLRKSLFAQQYEEIRREVYRRANDIQYHIVPLITSITMFNCELSIDLCYPL